MRPSKVCSCPLVFLKKTVKSLLIVAVLIHCFIALLIANPSSFAIRRWPWIARYASQLGFNTSWNFFSPDPAHPMFFHFRVYFADEEQLPIEGYWPPFKEQIITASSLRRTMYAMRYFVVSGASSTELFSSWLCRLYPGAFKVWWEHQIWLLPTLDQALIRRDENWRADMKQQKGISQEHYCPSQTELSEEGI